MTWAKAEIRAGDRVLAEGLGLELQLGICIKLELRG